MNIPLIEALEQMTGYTKLMEDLVTKKWMESFKTVDKVHYCSALVSRSLVEKKENLGAFTIPCTIGCFNFANTLGDLGARINLMPQQSTNS